MKQKEIVFSSPLAGEDAQRAGEGDKMKNPFYHPLIRATPTFSRQGRRDSGFTLIELLVVVLIIGILAAIALPQYQKAVLRARFTQAIVFVKAVHDAQESYYMANGSYPTDIDDLDIAFACPSDWRCEIYPERAEAYMAADGSLSIVYRVSHPESGLYPGKLYCWASTLKNAEMCKTIGNEQMVLEDATKYAYSLN